MPSQPLQQAFPFLTSGHTVFHIYPCFLDFLHPGKQTKVHRLLSAYLDEENTGSKDKYEKLCDHSSKMERLAAEAERASVKYKQVEYMSDKTGMVFEGVISGAVSYT